MSERDDFDKIVEGLHLDLSFPDEPADPVPDPLDVHDVIDDPLDEPAPAEEPFYRHVAPTPLVPKRQGVRWAWAGVLGAPLVVLLAALANVFIDRTLIGAAALIFVASAIYLFLQLPEHGPSRPDWPDDGAVL
jgi:hypothetical protein